jgi:hypothetical protein
MRLLQDLATKKADLQRLQAEIKALRKIALQELRSSEDWAMVDTEEDSYGETLGLSERYFHRSLWGGNSKEQFVALYIESEDLRDEIDPLEVEGVNCFYAFYFEWVWQQVLN